MTTIHKYKADLQKLIVVADTLRRVLIDSAGKGEDAELSAVIELTGNYQNWYTEALVLIKQLLPERLVEFEHLYKGDGRRREIDATTFTIQDWLNGIRAGTNYLGNKTYDDFSAAAMRFTTQLNILKSVESRFESSLFDIRQLVQADLFDSELDVAGELVNRGFLRAAGAVAGVVLEKHMSQVAQSHSVKTRKRNPTIGDFNELLKRDGVLDIPTWRQIQRLGDLRNLCTHHKQREPTKEEVQELIGGVERQIKTLF